MTRIRWDRNHKTDEVYNDNDHSGSLKIRFRNEWTGEVKAGRRGAQGWGWVRWEMPQMRAKSKQTSRKRKRDPSNNSTHNSQDGAAKKRPITPARGLEVRKVKLAHRKEEEEEEEEEIVCMGEACKV